MVQTNQDQSYRSALGLKRDPFAREPDAKFYYPFDSYEQRLQVLNHLVQGTDVLVLVIGESGSGKTTLLHRYLVTADVRWKTDRIQIDGLDTPDKPSRHQTPGSYPIFVQQDANDPIVIVDNAHRLPENDLKFLLREALVPGSSDRIKRLVLFGEPGLNNYIKALSDATSSDTAINKITMPALTRAETESYLQYRLALAGHTGESLFNSSVATMIHKKSDGLPGQINALADQWLRQKYAPNSNKEGMVTLLKRLPFKALGWGVAAIAVVIIGLFVFNRPDSTRRISPEMKLASMRVFRAKIPAVVDTDTPEPASRLTPAAGETTVRQSPESKEPPASTEQPTTLAKVEPQQVKKPQITPPLIKPAIPKKNGGNNTIYRESWLLDQDSSYYTLQVLGVRNEESLLDFIKRHKLLQKKNVAYYKTAYKGKQWYPLLYGVYPTKSDAAAAVKELPDKVQKSIPWIRKMSAVQNEVRVAAKR